MKEKQMPWPPRQPAREEISKEDLAAYEMAIQRSRRLGYTEPEKNAGYYGRLMLSPRLGNQLSEIGRTVRSLGDRGDTYSHADREFVDQVLSTDFATNIVQSVHLNDAVATGVRIAGIEALRTGHEENLTKEEAQLANFIRRVIAGRMDGATWEAMELRMGERGVLDYTIFILFLQLTMRLMSAVGMPSMTDSEVDAVIAEFKAGTREPEDFHTRIG
jgi:hypothetical protein